MRLAAAALALALGAGCTTAQDPTVEAGRGDTGAPASTAPPRGAPVVPPVSVPAPPVRSHLTGVQVLPSPGGGGGGRVVFEFDTVVPGYRIAYVERPVTEDGSGQEVRVDGAALLEVRLENAGQARIDGERVTPTYTGARRVAAPGGGGVVTEVVSVGDFEGVVTWVVGLTTQAPEVAVGTATGPARLVIDIPGAG